MEENLLIKMTSVKKMNILGKKYIILDSQHNSQLELSKTTPNHRQEPNCGKKGKSQWLIDHY